MFGNGWLKGSTGTTLPARRTRWKEYVLCFIDQWSPELFDEPILLVGQIVYKRDGSEPFKDVCGPWDLWEAFLKWCPGKASEKLKDVLCPKFLADRPIKSMKLIARPLYPIKSIEALREMMDKVKNL